MHKNVGCMQELPITSIDALPINALPLTTNKPAPFSHMPPPPQFFFSLTLGIFLTSFK